MTVVDASALVAILLEEDEADDFSRCIASSSDAVISPVGYWEAATRLRGLRGDQGVAELGVAMRQLGIRVEPASAQTARLATGAEKAFGKRTSAKLNLGDCFAYALARELDVPLLYKGDDFCRTDIRPALTG